MFMGKWVKKSGIIIIVAFIFLTVAGVMATIDHERLGVADEGLAFVTGILQITHDALEGEPAYTQIVDWIPCWGVNPWSADGTKIVYQSQPEYTNGSTGSGGSSSYNEICIINADGTGYQRLTDNDVCDTHGNFTPDGTKIVFQREGGTDTGNTEIYIMNVDGSDQESLSMAHGGYADCSSCGESKPIVSPDGRKIAFRHESSIWVMNIDGTNPRRVSGNLNGCTKHSWSPDSNWVLFNGSLCDEEDICGQKVFKARHDGVALVNLSGAEEMPWCENWAAWSPDGTKISFHRGNNNRDTEDEDISEIWIMNADGSGRQRLIGAIPDTFSDGEWACGPHSWSPDSKYIVFKKYLDEDSPLYIVNISTFAVTKLTAGYRDGRMWWGPDGTKILFKEYTSGTQRDGGQYNRDLLVLNLTGNFAYTNEAPSAPSLSSPTSGSTIADTMADLKWRASIDPEGTAVRYRVQIATNEDFTENFREYEVDDTGSLIGILAALPIFALFGWGAITRRKKPMMLAIGLIMAATLVVGCSSGGDAYYLGDEVSLEIANLEEGTTYYWRVFAIDEQGRMSDPSQTWSFTVPADL